MDRLQHSPSKHTARVRAAEAAGQYVGACESCPWISTAGDEDHAIWQAQAHAMMNHPPATDPAPECGYECRRGCEYGRDIDECGFMQELAAEEAAAVFESRQHDAHWCGRLDGPGCPDEAACPYLS